MSNVKLLVLLDKAERGNMTQMATALEGHGMVVERQMKLTGTISGYAPEETVEELRALKGIAELRQETTMKAISDDYDYGP